MWGDVDDVWNMFPRISRWRRALWESLRPETNKTKLVVGEEEGSLLFVILFNFVFLEEEEEEWMMVYIEWGRIYFCVTYVEHMRYDGEMNKYLCE